MPSPIVYGDYLYVCSNSGILTCFQAKTGELVYKKRLPMQRDRSFVGSPVAADGYLYLTSEEGETAVIKAGPTFELVANNHCGEICLTTPAISRGTLYLRGQRHLFAFRESHPAAQP
jgi:outer membrane protein assembly factor BamB